MTKKKNNDFNIPYIGFDNLEGFDVMAHNESHLSITFKCNFSFSTSLTASDYQESIFSILQLLEGYYFQKHDVFLENSILTYITIIKPSNGGFFTHSNKKYDDFVTTVNKLKELLANKGFQPQAVRWKEFNHIIKQFLAFNFYDDKFKLTSIERNDFEIIFNKKRFVQSKSFSNNREPGNSKQTVLPFPIDLLNFIFDLENNYGKIYHQVIYIPEQKKELKKLDGELRRAAAKYGEEEIESIERFKLKISQENELLAYAHFDLFYSATSLEELKAISNLIDDKVAPHGITPSKNNFSQFDIYYASFPGNAMALKEEDLFKTTCQPLTSFICKDSPFVLEG